MAPWSYYDRWTGQGWYVYTDTCTTSLTSATPPLWLSSTTSSTAVGANWWYDGRLVRSYMATREAIARAETRRQDPALLAHEREQHRIAQARLTHRRALRESAAAKAEALLLRHLTPAQQQTYRHYGWFEIEVSGRVYRLEQGFTGNVTRRDPVTRRTVRRYCAHVELSLPVQDNLLAQLLLLSHNEQEFLRVANVS